MAAESILNAWIDANVLLCLLVIAWLPIRSALSFSKLGQAAIGQARAMEWVFLAVLLSPLLSRAVAGIGVETPTLSDLLVAHYLHGNVDLSARRFETLLSLREDITGAFLLQNAAWAQALLAFLALGAATCLLRLGTSTLRLRRILRRAHPWRSFGRLTLVVSDEVTVPFSTCNLWRRYVVLPTGTLGHGRDAHFTLAHEFQHLRQSDLAYEVLVELLRPLFFWNPAFRICCHQIRELRELACDQALAQRRPTDLGGYCRSLIRASARARDGGPHFAPVSLAVGFVGTRQGAAMDSQLGRRIVALTGHNPSVAGQATWKGIGLLLCGLLVIGAVLMQRPSGWTHDRIMLSTIVNLERLGERNSLNATSSAVPGNLGATSIPQ